MRVIDPFPAEVADLPGSHVALGKEIAPPTVGNLVRVQFVVLPAWWPRSQAASEDGCAQEDDHLLHEGCSWLCVEGRQGGTNQACTAESFPCRGCAEFIIDTISRPDSLWTRLIEIHIVLCERRVPRSDVEHFSGFDFATLSLRIILKAKNSASGGAHWARAEKQLSKLPGRKGFDDVWKRGLFAWKPSLWLDFVAEAGSGHSQTRNSAGTSARAFHHRILNGPAIYWCQFLIIIGLLIADLQISAASLASRTGGSFRVPKSCFSRLAAWFSFCDCLLGLCPKPRVSCRPFAHNCAHP